LSYLLGLDQPRSGEIGIIKGQDADKLKRNVVCRLQLEPLFTMALEIGQNVKIIRLRDRVPSETASRLGKVGQVREFKMTDGSGVGVVVQFDDKYATWFFEDELGPA
jgi:hypothetical protein